VESDKAVEEETRGDEFLTTCVNCQTTVPSNVLYCWNCGQRVRGSPKPEPPQPQEEAGPPEEKVALDLGPNDRYVCPDCGKAYGPYNNSRGAYIRHRRKVHGDV